MFHRVSGRGVLFLCLLLGLCFSLVACDEEEDEENLQEAIQKVHTEKPEADTEVAVENAETSITLEECDHPDDNTKNMCCRSILTVDDDFIKCVLLHHKKMPNGTHNQVHFIKFISCLVECVFKVKKYIGKGNTVNMKMVKSDANKLYDEPREREFYIEMYQYCEKKAAEDWSAIKKNVAGRILFTGSCKPYYMYLLACVMGYGKISCPYFKWSGTKANARPCKDLKEKCEQMQK